MNTITLNDGCKVMVSDEDFEIINQFKWTCVENHAYASRWEHRPKKGILMHRQILNIGQSTSAVPIDLVESVWANGAELEMIRRDFEGIPLRFNRHADHDQTMKWFGDDARFIVANWT